MKHGRKFGYHHWNFCKFICKLSEPIGIEKAFSEIYKKEKVMELEQKRWLTPTDFELLFGVYKSTQAKMRMLKSESNLPFVKFGKFIRYDRYEIDKWLESNKVVGA